MISACSKWKAREADCDGPLDAGRASRVRGAFLL